MHMADLSIYKYKVSYHHGLMCTMFVRVKDDAILYTNTEESLVKAFADGFCVAKNEKFYIE